MSTSLNKNDYQLLINKILSFINKDEFTLILNAAKFYSSSNRLIDKDLREFFEVNLFSCIELVKSLEVFNLKRIFIINSISGIIGQSNQHEYSSAKHALMGFSRSLAKSAKNSKYDVMTINPGGMKTSLWKDNTSDFLNPESIADVCINLLLIPERTFIENMSIIPPSDL